MGDTDDTSIYRDTKISRYWYIAYASILFGIATPEVSRYFVDTFVDTTHVAKPLMHYFRNFVILDLIDISTIGLLLAYDIGDIAIALVGLTVIVKLLAPLSST